MTLESAEGTPTRERPREHEVLATTMTRLRPAYFFTLLVSVSAVSALALPPIEDLGKRNKEVVLPLAEEEGLVFLSSFKPLSIKRIDCAPFVGDYSVRIENGLRIGGKHSLSVHPLAHNDFSAVSFALDKEYDGILGFYGFIEPDPREGSTLTFIVQTDKSRLWKSDPVTRQKPYGFFAVPLRGKRKVELWVSLKGFFEGTHAGWIEPALIPAEFDLKQRVNSLREQANKLQKKDLRVFDQRATLLRGVATIRGDKQALFTIEQAEKAASYQARLKPKG